MKLFKVLTLVLLCLASSVHAQVKRSLIIGIGEYKDPAWTRINADNDIEYISKILNFYKFKELTVLRNSQATKQAIIQEFDSLIDRCGKGDVVYVQFSGHGQRMLDLNGDEDDGFDESWVPYDAYYECCMEDSGDKHLVDDEIYQMLTGLREKIGETGQILVVVDACYSGDSTRSPGEGQSDYVYRGARDAFVPTTKVSFDPTIVEDWVWVSACEDFQVNCEVRKPQVGKLTYCLYKLRYDLASMSNDDLIEMLTEMMESREILGPLPQNPCLGGGYDKYAIKEIFRK